VLATTFILKDFLTPQLGAGGKCGDKKKTETLHVKMATAFNQEVFYHLQISK
jgi:hypothetical protein